MPRLKLRWPGFRRVRRQVCRRLRRRLLELELAALADYRAFLAGHPEEWRLLDGMCRITISRFYRDRAVWDELDAEVLPRLAREAAGDGVVRCWSVGCASGEEPYTLSLLGQRLAARSPIRLAITASDADPTLLARARRGCYPEASLRDLPLDLQARFRTRGGERCLEERFRRDVTLIEQDIRSDQPPGPFRLILCRNLVLTYFAPEVQREVLTRMLERLTPGGVLVIGAKEALPGDLPELVAIAPRLNIYRKIDAGQRGG